VGKLKDAIQGTTQTVVGILTTKFVAHVAPMLGAAPAPVLAGLALAPTAATRVAGLAFGTEGKKVQKKIDAWFNETSILMELGSVEAAEKVISEKIDEEWAHKAVIDGVRTILNDINEACVPFLASVTAHAIKMKTVPDDRTRRFTSMLVELDPKTLAATREVVGYANRYQPSDTASLSVTVYSGQVPSDDGLPKVGLTMRFTTYRETTEVAGEAPATTATFDALAILKRYRFANDLPGGYLDVESGPNIAGLLAADIKYLGTFLRVGSLPIP
jgi:hypothetical protein